ncbi:D-hexose-6-phosphate mutarotase [Catenovulum sp. 2E275]|uniref:D-hexose-6-phosphate mutarotase n=1 Tax=Catenovulum sp. 2E275 TaxID=2980497 RepID=UPI0021D21421|nr:D-hexose-6-phosphate mutarotase [Catenovulum sp. 2E275]MCU4676313.1 D-hexose-6-phosphate mutarotase [Catenovulum sp. 2E275]
MSATENLISLAKSVNGVSVSTADVYFGAEHQALPLIMVETELCKAVIAVQGAHVIEFTPVDEAPLLWVSPKAEYKQGKPIRGGVPVCFPWFGENQLDKSKPSHGFVRNFDWQVSNIQTLADQSVELTFAFTSTDETLKLYPYHFTAQYTVTVGKTLKLALQVNNTGDQTMPVSFALHSYHPVQELSTTYVDGLHWTSFLDNTKKYQAHIQQGPVYFDGEVDRIYLNVQEEQIIQTEPAIKLASRECKSAVVWNPGYNKAASIGDLGGENYQAFICVERGNAFSDSWYLAPNEQRSAELEISHY